MLVSVVGGSGAWGVQVDNTFIWSSCSSWYVRSQVQQLAASKGAAKRLSQGQMWLMRMWSILSSHVEIYGVLKKSFATHSTSHKLSGYDEYLVRTPSTMLTTMLTTMNPLTTMPTTMPSMVHTYRPPREREHHLGSDV